MVRLREKTGEGQPLELAITEKLRFAGIEDIDDAVVLLCLYLIGFRRDRDDKALPIARQDDLAMTDTAAENEGAKVVQLVPDAQEAHTNAPSPT